MKEAKLLSAHSIDSIVTILRADIRRVVHGIPQSTGAGFENWKFRVEKLQKSAGLLDAVEKAAPTVAAELADKKTVNLIIK